MTNKEQFHHWGRTFLLLLGIVFAGGGYVMKIRANSANIEKVEVKSEANEKSIHTIELNQRDMQGVYDGISKSLSGIEAAQSTQATSQQVIVTAQREIVTDVAVIKEKVGNLERAD